MKLPHSKLYQKNNQRLIPSVMKKAVIVGFSVGSKVANIYFVENPQTIIKNVPMSDQVQSLINSNVINKNCVVDIFDESNANQMIIAYTY